VATTPSLKMKTTWAVWAKGGAWLSTLLMSFVIPPPTDISDPQAVNATIYTRFLLALLTGLFAVLTAIWKQPKNARLWFAASIACAAVSVLFVFLYENVVQGRTASYDGKQVVIGSVLTPVGESDSRPGILPEDRVMDAGGRVAMVWTADSIRANAFVVRGAYLLVMVSSGLCILLLLEATRRAQSR
jgi:hypothetical protein